MCIRDRVGNEVVTALQLRIDVLPRVVNAVAQGDQVVVDAGDTHGECGDDDDDEDVYKRQMEILDHYGIDCTGKKAVVIGRSLVVGKPAAMMLVKKNATVTICHTRTVDMPTVAREADIIIVAAGRAGVVGADYVKAGQVVIDVGINVNAEGKLCGDVDYAAVEPIVDAITPVPGGVGSVTTSVLVGHVVEAAMRKVNA